jgi:hypothetical protein
VAVSAIRTLPAVLNLPFPQPVNVSYQTDGSGRLTVSKRIFIKRFPTKRTSLDLCLALTEHLLGKVAYQLDGPTLGFRASNRASYF